jgi:FkbM family methyltransferase
MKKAITDIKINQMRFNVLPCVSKDGDYWDTVNKGKWEPETFEFMKNYIQPDKNYIELGGWIGSTALAAYAFNPKKVYTIEADPANYQILKHNIALNLSGDKITAFQACLTDKANSGKVVMFGTANEEKPNSSSHRLDNGSRVKVLTTNALPFLKKNCDLKNTSAINIDIEGSERYLGDMFNYFKNKDVAILLSLHNPFWQDNVKTANDMYSYIQKYTIIDPFTYNEISKSQIKEKLFENKFYSIILQGKGR